MHKVVILGGGFAGVRAALDLERLAGDHVQITLIDRNNFHLFTPSLYEVASAFRADTDPYAIELRRAVAIPFAAIFENKKIQLVHGIIERINVAQQNISTRSGQVFPYDSLIIGVGTESSDFNVPGVLEYAYPFKTIEDGLMVHKRLQTIFYEAQHGQRPVPLHIIVGGGGFTGVELAAEIASCASKLTTLCQLERHCFYVTIVESKKMMKFLSEKEQHTIRRRLTSLGVAIVEGTLIQEVRDGEVRLSDGQKLKSDMTIWATGTRPNRLLHGIPGLELTPTNGKVVVDQYLRTPHFSNVYAVGDAIEFIDKRTNAPEPAMAYIAIEHGVTAARNIIRAMKGSPLRPHIPPSEVWVAPVGGKFAVAHLWAGISIRGILGWLLREIIDFRYFMTILPLKKAFKIFWHQTQEFTRND